MRSEETYIIGGGSAKSETRHEQGEGSDHQEHSTVKRNNELQIMFKFPRSSTMYYKNHNPHRPGANESPRIYIDC